MIEYLSVDREIILFSEFSFGKLFLFRVEDENISTRK